MASDETTNSEELSSDAPTMDLGRSQPQTSTDTDATLPSSSVTNIASIALSQLESAASRKVQYFGDYELLGELARGGMGVVYKARQVNLNRIVALKMILAGQLASQEDVKRFYTEAEAAAALDHPGIVPIFEIGQHEEQHFFSMGFVDGGSLSDKLKDGPLAPAEAASYTRKVAEAIAYAHAQGVIHRDLKPANVLLDQSNQPKVTDFGLARRAESNSDLTRTGAVMGTPSYMPPEQASGKTDEVGPLADVYSLGAILYCLLTGRPPFQASNPLETLMQVIKREPVKPSELVPTIPRDLETICLKCLQKDPTKRYASAQDFADDLGRWLMGEPIKARAVSSTERAWQWVKRHRTVSALVASTTAAVLIGSAVSIWFGFVATREATRAHKAEEVALASAEESRRYLYVGHMNLVQRNWDANQLTPLRQLLNRYGPASPKNLSSLRGFEWYYFNRMADSSMATLRMNSGESQVFSVAFSPDGARLVSCGEKLELWEVSTGQKTATLAEYSFFEAGNSNGVAFSPDGTRLALGRSDNTIKLWDVATGKETATLTGHSDMVLSVAFSPNGKRLASGALDNTVKFWDMSTGQETATLNGHSGGVHSVAFSPDGTRLASSEGEAEYRIKLWNVATGREMATLTGHSSYVVSVAFSPDGTRLASGSHDNTIKLWEVDTGLETATLTGSSLAFSPDGTQLASASYKTVKLWDVSTGREMAKLQGHVDEVRSVAFNREGNRLVSGSLDNTIKLWDPFTGQEVATLRGHLDGVPSVAVSSDGTRLASGSFDGTVKVWDLSNGQEAASLRGHASEIAFSPDGARLASSSYDGTVKLWDVSTGRETATLTHSDLETSIVAFSPDGTRLAGRSDNTIRLWNVATGQETVTLRGHLKGVSSVAFSPDGKRLASGALDNTVKFWDMSTGQEMATLNGHSGGVHSVAFSPDGARLASSEGEPEYRIKLWDVSTRRAIVTLRGHLGTVCSVAFSPDGTRLASGSLDTTIKLWEVSTGKEIASLPGESGITSVAFSPDGTRLASGGDDDYIKLWDVFTGQEAARLNRVGGTWLKASVAFSPDGTRLASPSDYHTIKVWDARPWTPETRLEQQALCLVRGMLSKSDSEEALLTAIRENKSFTEQARKLALDYAPLFWKSREASSVQEK